MPWPMHMSVCKVYSKANKQTLFKKIVRLTNLHTHPLTHVKPFPAKRTGISQAS